MSTARGPVAGGDYVLLWTSEPVTFSTNDGPVECSYGYMSGLFAANPASVLRTTYTMGSFDRRLEGEGCYAPEQLGGPKSEVWFTYW
jgi:hypothetical protein